jgi:uncharacterized repeat protein (TIGR01451 family)
VNKSRFYFWVAYAWMVALGISFPWSSALAQSSKPDPTLSHRKLDKIRVFDEVTARTVRQLGGELVGDYGSFKIFKVDSATAEALKDNKGVERATAQNRILLNTAELDTSTTDLQSQRKSAVAFPGRKLHLIQFAGPVQPAWRAELEQSGVKIINYVPHNAYLVYGDLTSVNRMKSRSLNVSHVQWEGDYLDAYKIHPNALPNKQNRLNHFSGHLFAVQLVNDAGANAATLKLIDEIKLAPIRRQFNTSDYLNLIVSLPQNRLADVAAMPEVISIQPYIEPKKNDERQNQIVAGNLNGTLPDAPGYLNWLVGKGFNQEQFLASGFAVDISDSGVDNGTTSPGHFGLYQFGDTNLASRLIYSRLEGSPNGASTTEGCDGHGNINAHIIAGFNDQPAGFPHTDSQGFRYGLGVCPFVKVGSSVIFDPDAFTFPFFDDLQSRAYQDGARISANSWGASVGGQYTFDSQSYDRLVRDAQPDGSAFATSGNQQMVIVFAAGNDGPGGQTVGSPGTAKNVITVGAAENVRSHSTENGGNDPQGNDGCFSTDTEADSANDIAIFSSRGPCSDGRAKPDIVAPGTHITGGVAQNSPPASVSSLGNALDCFNATGICSLPGGGSVENPNNFFPMGQEFYSTSSGTSHSTPAVAGGCALLRQYFVNKGFPVPSPALTKAYLMNSARYLDGDGANDSLWSFNQGMGELNLGHAFDDESRVLRDQLTEDKFTASGQTKIITGTIPNSSKPFRVTLAWTDSPGNTFGDAFNNDLDLTVTVNGVTYKGNVFDGVYSISGGSSDFRNNVESVFLPAGLSGNFVVTVTAANINSDGVPNEEPALDQDFALVIYNAQDSALPVMELEQVGVIAEQCPDQNLSIDPNETVTVAYALNNIGLSDTTNLVVTLLSAADINVLGGPQTYGAVLAGGSAVTQAFSFVVTGACGDAKTLQFQLQDGDLDLGILTRNFTLGNVQTTTFSHTNPETIWIPVSETIGPSFPFPSEIAVSGITGAVSKVTVTIHGLTHSYPDDLDVLLVGPTGEKVILMSDAGGGQDVYELNLVFDDDVFASLPNDGAVASGSYRPGDFGNPEVFSPPAPDGPFSFQLSAFAGLDPNGIWQLYVEDDALQDIGNISQGWSLSVTTSNVSCCSIPIADLVLNKTVSSPALNAGDNVTFTLSVTNQGPEGVTTVTVTDELPAGLNFIDATMSQGDFTNVGSVVTFDIGPIAVGASATMIIEATAAMAGNWTNAALLQASVIDPVSANNTGSVEFSINARPVISDIEDVTIYENTSTNISFTIGDLETDAELLLVHAFSSDTNLVRDDDIVLGGSGSNRSLSITPQADTVGTAMITVSVDDGFAAVTDSFILTVFPETTNHVPVLDPMPDIVIFEGTLLTVTNVAEDSDAPPQELSFSMAGPLPGANVDPKTGILTWVPTESQGPGTNFLQIIVWDDGFPGLSATQTFAVIVLESNMPPSLSAIASHTVHAGATLFITNSATDSDFPSNTLVFALETNSPPSATINATNGLVTWTAGSGDTNGTYDFTVRVTDDGVPPLSDQKSFLVTVSPRPVIDSISISNDLVMLTWSTISNHVYRLQFASNATATHWSDIIPDVMATGPAATGFDTLPNAGERYYRVQVVP